MSSSRVIVALLLCCVLVLMRVMGVHVHVVQDPHEQAVPSSLSAHAQWPGEHSHHHAASRLVSEFGDHVAAHLNGAEVDADSPAETTGKLPSQWSSQLLVALVFCLATLLIPARGRRTLRPDYTPPAPRRTPHVLPLSQAPPHFA